MSILLHLENVRFGWDTNSDILEIESFTIRRGEHCFIKGPSGCGKSTLLSLIGGVVTPREGRVILDGTDLTEQKPADRDRTRADTVGFIFQQFNLVPYLNAYENVLLPCQFSKQRTESALRQGDSTIKVATQLLDGFFATVTPDYNQPVAKLSVGQQQRVAAARALMGSPALVIADEPTSALDHDNRSRFMSQLLGEVDRQGSTLLFVSHDPTLANQFNRVHNMSQINKNVIG